MAASVTAEENLISDKPEGVAGLDRFALLLLRASRASRASRSSSWTPTSGSASARLIVIRPRRALCAETNPPDAAAPKTSHQHANPTACTAPAL